MQKSAKSKNNVTLANGIVTEVLDAEAKVRVEIPDQGIVTKPLPVLVPYALQNKAYAMPDVSSHCIVLLDGNGIDGAVLGYFYDEKTPPPVSDRALYHHSFPPHLFEFNRETGVLTINCTRIDITVNQGMHIDNAQESTINNKAIAVIGAMDNDSESNGPDVLVSSGQI